MKHKLKKTLSLLKKEGQVFEIRMMDENKYIMSGYFDNIDDAIKDLKRVMTRGWQVYVTLNELSDSMKSRSQFGKIQKLGNKPATSKKDVVGYDWLFVDLDPDRSTGVSSTDEELRLAKEVGNKVYAFMSQLGFEKPITAFSGNGVHLLYRIYLENNETNEKIISQAIDTLNMLFSTDKIKIDKANKDANRVCKLYGTLAQKGLDTEDRPHRMSSMTNTDEEIKPTPLVYLKKLIDMQPKMDERKSYNNFSPEDFDIEQWMSNHMIRYEKTNYDGGTKYILDCCPFDSNHKGKDACIFMAKNHALGFHCFHNSCADKTWKDVRMLYEPDAYERKNKAREKIQYGSFNRNKVKESTPIVQQENKPIFFNAKSILDIPKAEETFVKTGYTDIDKKLRGLKKGFTSVWSGLRGSGKSSVLSQLGLDARQAGNNVGYFSGELAPKNFMRWMNQQAAGKSGVEPGAYEGYYNVPIQRQKEIAEWLGDHMWLYNNDYGNDSVAILEQFEKAIDEKKLDMLILDNLMAFDITTMSADKYEAQKMFVWKLHEMAQKYDTHIAFVAHPRKSMGFLRLDDISGSADIANAVEYAFIVHRNNNDFKRLSKDMFGWKESEPVYSGTNVIEICKDRDGGTQDYFIPLFYEIESKRLKNDPSENKIYGWDKRSDHVYGFDAINFEIEETPFD